MVKRYLHSRAEQNTLSDTDAPTTNSGTLMGLLGGLANRVRAITGKGSWTASPDATLADAATHHGRADNPHSVTRAQLGAAAASALSSHTADQSNPHEVTAAQAGALPVAQKGAASGVAPLDAGSRIPSAHIPPIAITERFVVGSQSAQLALAAQEGDIAIRTDQSRTYIKNAGAAGTMADWTELATPPDAIQSVDGRTGTVSLSDRYAPSSHVGSGGSAHPAATVSQAGFITPADKQRLNRVIYPERVFVASFPGISQISVTYTSSGWQTTPLPHTINVPALGDAPAGFAWKMDIIGAVRVFPPANDTFFLSIGYDSAVTRGVNGGVYASTPQVPAPVYGYALNPPTLTSAFVIRLYPWIGSATGTWSYAPGPDPIARCYLVETGI